MALPAFGVLLYLFVQLDVGHRYANRRVQESIVSTVQYVPRQTELMTRLRTELPEVHNLAEYTLRSGDYPVYENTAVTYYPMGQDKIGALLDALPDREREAVMLAAEGYTNAKSPPACSFRSVRRRRIFLPRRTSSTWAACRWRGWWSGPICRRGCKSSGC